MPLGNHAVALGHRRPPGCNVFPRFFEQPAQKNLKTAPLAQKHLAMLGVLALPVEPFTWVSRKAWRISDAVFALRLSQPCRLTASRLRRAHIQKRYTEEHPFFLRHLFCWSFI